MTLDNQFNFLKELKDHVRKQDIDNKVHFRNKVLNKLQMDMKSWTSKRSAAKFLVESFGDLLDDFNFACWLAKQLELKPCRLKEIIKNAYTEFTPWNYFNVYIFPTNHIQLLGKGEKFYHI